MAQCLAGAQHHMSFREVCSAVSGAGSPPCTDLRRMPLSLRPLARVRLASSIISGDSKAIRKLYMPASILAPESLRRTARKQSTDDPTTSEVPVNCDFNKRTSTAESKQRPATYVRHMRLPHNTSASFLPELDDGAVKDCRQGAATSFLPFGESETLIPRRPSVNTSFTRLLGARPPSLQSIRQRQTPQAEPITSHSPNSWQQTQADRTDPSRFGHWNSPKGHISASHIPSTPYTLNPAKVSSRQITTADCGSRDGSWSQEVPGGFDTSAPHPDDGAHSAPSTAAYYEQGFVDPDAPLAPLDVLEGFCDDEAPSEDDAPLRTALHSLKDMPDAARPHSDVLRPAVHVLGSSGMSNGPLTERLWKLSDNSRATAPRSSPVPSGLNPASAVPSPST